MPNTKKLQRLKTGRGYQHATFDLRRTKKKFHLHEASCGMDFSYAGFHGPADGCQKT